MQRRSVPGSVSLGPVKVVAGSYPSGGGSNEAVGAWDTSGGVGPPCELAGRNEMNIVEIVRCSRHTLWRFCGVWYCDSLQCHKKTKIRSLAKHNVFAVLLTPPQGGIATDRESHSLRFGPAETEQEKTTHARTNKIPNSRIADAKRAKPLRSTAHLFNSQTVSAQPSNYLLITPAPPITHIKPRASCPRFLRTSHPHMMPPPPKRSIVQYTPVKS